MGVHQGSVLSPLLFVIVREALSWEVLFGVLLEDFYADDLVIISDMLEECVGRLSHGEEGAEGNRGKDKIHGLLYRPEPPAEFKEVSMCGLSYRSRQQQHLLQWLQTPR